MQSQDLYYWLALDQIENIGPVSFVRLVEDFGSPQKVLGLSKADISDLNYLSQPARASLIKGPNFKQLEHNLTRMDQSGVHVYPYTHSDYPTSLKQIHSFPPLLYVLGDIDCLNQGSWLGVVGSRALTEYGAVACQKAVNDLVAQGLRIVSGFARGVDVAAHLTTLDRGGITAAVLAGGFQYIYPHAHRRYVDRIVASGGAVVSEFSYDTRPLPQFFPRRNRIISGLARGVLVVEAGVKSGAMITAQYALEQNRDVYAIPGSILSKQSAGCHKLLNDGAKLYSQASDILNDWNLKVSEPSPVIFDSPEESQIYQLCSGNSITPDDIIKQTGITSDRVSVLLTQLELKGRIQNLPGRRYQSL